jgi:hypothetical protein
LLGRSSLLLFAIGVIRHCGIVILRVVDLAVETVEFNLGVLWGLVLALAFQVAEIRLKAWDLFGDAAQSDARAASPGG